MQALLHAGPQSVLNPCVGGLQALAFKDAANLRFDGGGVAGKAQEVVAGELDEEFSIYLPLERENPLADVEG